jgi:hypothetical protein
LGTEICLYAIEPISTGSAQNVRNDTMNFPLGK